MKIFKDIDDNQFWLTLWSGASVAILLAITVFCYIEYAEDQMVKELVQEGHDPIKVACLYKRDNTLSATCLILSQQKDTAYK